MEEKTITALMVAPGEHPSVTNLCCCKQFLDLAVSFGAMEPCEVTFMPLSERASILYNREAPLLDLRGNRKIDSQILNPGFFVQNDRSPKSIDITGLEPFCTLF